MRIGAQLYGVGHNLGALGSETFRMLAEMGYREVEPCILFAEGYLYQDTGLMKPEELLTQLPQIRENGLELRSAHAYCLDFNKDADAMCALARDAGIEA